MGNKKQIPAKIRKKYEALFPNLKHRIWFLTSPATPRYNCMAWALNNDEVVFWPDSARHYRWPRTLLRATGLDVFVAFFQKAGFSPCGSSGYSKRHEKIALYARDNLIVTHVARQTGNGLWTSKLGKEHDIEHKLEGLEGKEYGEVVLIMQRDRKMLAK